MRTGAIMRMALLSMRRSPMRTVFTGSGLLLGVLAITLTVATGEGARRAVLEGWKAMVGNLDAIFISPGGPAQRGMATMDNSVATLTEDDAIAIATSVSNVQSVAIEQSRFGAAVEANGKNGTTALLGISPNWVVLRGNEVVLGRMFTDQQNDAVERVAVIGHDLARDYFAGTDPLGQRLTIEGVEFEVIGVLEQNGAGPGGASMDNLVLVPIRTTARRVFNRPHLQSIRIQMQDPGRSTETAEAVTALLRTRHSIAPGELDDFRITTPRALIAQRANVDTSLRRTILRVGILALILGGVLVANLMYASVSHRTSEIGMRRAVGAKRRDILREFWVEAVVVSAAAGALGVVLSLIAILVGGAALGFPLAPSWAAMAAALGATVAVGFAAGIVPATRAARVPPATALREQG